MIQNIITWNVRGLGKPSKRFLVKNFLELHLADVCCFQESKLSDLNQSIWRDIGGGRLDSFRYIPAKGYSGGMIIGWNSSLRNGRVVFEGSFCLTVEFTNLADNTVWWCTSVYGPNLSHLKQSFWNEIRACNTNLPWVICGNFNAIFAIEDKSCGVPNLRDIRCAQDLLCNLNLVEPPLVGRRFTWTNGQASPTWVKLDRFLTNPRWNMLYPRAHQVSLPRLGSDHVPIRLEAGAFTPKARIFRFEQVWFSDDNLVELIKG